MQQPAHHRISPLSYHPAYEVLEQSERQKREHLQYTLRRISETSYRKSAHTARSVHHQSHGLIYGEMEIYDQLPEHLAQGMFAQASKLPLVMRFSTVPGDILNDRRCTPRSLAIKVIGVEGERLPGSEDAITQDFLLVNGASFLSCSVQRFLANLQLLAATDHTPAFK
ncbi:MAG TPA: catalase, partial [Methylophilus sp.]